MVSTQSFLFMAIAGAMSVIFPILILIWASKRGILSWKSVGIGALIFLVFSQILEKILHLYVFQWSDLSSNLENPWLFALYGGFAAAIFEEGGRVIAFKYFLRKQQKWGDAVSYGVGHGGMEALLIGGLGAINLMIYSSLINNGSFDALVGSQLPKEQALMLKETLLSNDTWTYLLGGMERFIAIILQIALSVLVFYGLRSGKYKFVLYAVLLHVAFDFAPAMYQKGYINIWAAEGILLLLTIPSVFVIIQAKEWIEG